MTGIDIDKFLSAPISSGSALNSEDKKELIPAVQIVELAEGQIDPRLTLLSHSSRTTLHKCPRKYQLYRLSATSVAMDNESESKQALTFSYGSAVGVGVQSCLEGKSEDQIYLDTFMEWDSDLLYVNTKQNKSFWLCMQAVKKFISLRERGFLSTHSLVYFSHPKTGEQVPAVELDFQITLPNGYKYRGFVDAVLKDNITGEVLVLELKTSSGSANSAMYKNSGQALGYSVILDILFPEMSSYTVLYLVYETKSLSYKELPYTKSLMQRALWLQELLIDTQLIDIYNSYGVYPTHGESCFDFFRDCEYLGMCHMNTAGITKPLTTAIVDKIKKADEAYTFNIAFDDLVNAQISKGELI